MANFQISKKQARQIGLSISADVKAYVQSHNEAYQAFLRQANNQKSSKRGKGGENQ